MARPRPVPPSARARAESTRKNRSNTRGRAEAGIPIPVSRTSTWVNAPSCWISTTMEPPSGVYRMALAIRFWKTWMTPCRSAETVAFPSREKDNPRAEAPSWKLSHRSSNHRAKFHLLVLGHPTTRLQPGKIEQVVDQVLKPEGVGPNRGKEGAAKILRRVVLEKGLGEPPERGEGSLQLVRYIGDEIAANDLQPANLRNVEEDDDRTAALDGLGRNQELSVPKRELPARKRIDEGFLQQVPEAWVCDEIPEMGAGNGPWESPVD